MLFKTKTLVWKDKISWLALDYDRLFLENLKQYNFLYDVRDAKISDPHPFVELDSENFRTIRYHGVSLYEAVIYSVCVESEQFIDEITLNQATRPLFEKWYSIACNYIDSLQDIFKKRRFDLIVSFQGYLCESSILRQMAKWFNVPIVSFENTGYAKKITWGIEGNALSGNIARKLYQHSKKTININCAKDHVNNYLKNISSIKKAEHATQGVRFQKSFTNRKTIVFLGQVYTDASILFGLFDGFYNPVNLIREIIRYATKNDVSLIIKLHPKEHCGANPINFQNYNYLTWCKIQQCPEIIEILNSSNDILQIDWDNRYDTFSIISQSDAVVTVNSQSGLEAAIMGKPVVLCGQAFYGNLGFTIEVSDKDKLFAALDNLLTGDVSHLNFDEAFKFFYYYFEHYCITANEAALTKKILKILKSDYYKGF